MKYTPDIDMFLIFRKTIRILAFVLISCTAVKSQCLKLPYRENFELSDGGWTTGGTASDWAWGTPVKSSLTAISGKNCWTTGALTKNSYNGNQLSWLQTPCLDFSDVKYPYVEFRIFQSTEEGFDGATLEYSTDGGATWKTAGSTNDPINCFNGNWFNTSEVKDLNNKPGWSGSHYWLWAYHTFPFLSGKSNVIFRFVFGSGDKNNVYDGIAVDNFFAGETEATDATFTYKCVGGATVEFAAVSNSGCPGYSWDFDDPASGSSGTSETGITEHTFSGPGQYKVTLSTFGSNNAPSRTTQIINILGPVTKIISSPACYGDKNGAASVSVSPAVVDAAYTWSTFPVQYNDTATNLGLGTYRVSVTAPNSCPADTTVTITEPKQLSSSTITDHASCNKADGRIKLGTSGGTSPYSYTWSPNVSPGPEAVNLGPGPYSVLVRDAKGCTESINIIIETRNAPQATISNSQDPLCHGNGGSATVSVTGGDAPYNYTWSPSGGIGATAFFATGGRYTVIVTDKNGCSDTATLAIIEPGLMVSNITKQDVSCGTYGKATANISGGELPLSYSWTSAAGSYTSQQIDNLAPGDYHLTVTDKNGCKVSDKVTINAGNDMQIVVNHKNVTCSGDRDGTASLVVSGGIPGYSTSWSNGVTGPALENLPAGTYTATVRDGSGCTSKATVVIEQPPPLDLSIATTHAICANNNGKLESTVSGGTLPYEYEWKTLLPGTPAVDGLSPGKYFLYVTDKNGCKDSATATVESVNPLEVSLGKDTTICRPGTILLVPGSYRSYAWQDGSSNPTFTVTGGGRYSVTVRDSRGCTASSSINILSDCGEVYFPSAFTPNGDNLNKHFGPIGNLSLIKSYRLKVYNRWGQLVFQSNNPFEKWDGRTGDKLLMGTYTWFVTYSTAREPNGAQKGTITLVL